MALPPIKNIRLNKMESQDQQKEEELRFLFGKNWNNFIQFHFSEERVNISKTTTCFLRGWGWPIGTF